MIIRSTGGFPRPPGGQRAHAHGFGERYDLPVPLGYFMVGAGVAVALSFVVIGWFGRVGERGGGYWRCNLLGLPLAGPLLTNPLVLLPVKLLSMFLLGLVIAAGLFGSQVPSLNFAPTFVWVIWWVGLGFFVALVGNAWALVNPWKAHLRGGRVECAGCSSPASGSPWARAIPRPGGYGLPWCSSSCSRGWRTPTPSRRCP